MFRLVKCTELVNSQLVKKQCTILASGYHCTSILNSNGLTSTKLSNTEPYQPVADFYAGRSIFLTGGTGFLGKTFIERLLTNCSEIDKIYVLIRPQKGAPAEQRLQDLLENPVFTDLKSTKPDQLKKLVPISGDVTEPKLGIKPEDEQTLIDNVSVVFHSAAYVKFSQTLKTAININLEGTKKMMQLGQQMKNLEIFVHISTTYSNTDKLILEEVVYPPARSIDEVYRFLKNNVSDEEESEKFLCGHVNNYGFSKGLTEALLLEQHNNMRTIIVRPSIVSPFLKAPLSGWLDSWVAGTATFSDVSRGLTRVIYGTKDTVLDMIPVDYVCNLAIVAAAKSPKVQDILVYNSCTSSSNPITWIEAAKLFAKDSKKFGFNELPFPTVFASQSAFVVSTVTFLLQTIPSFIADLLLRVTGRKPKYMKLQPRAVLLRDMLKSVSGINYYMKSNRAQELIATLDAKDHERFLCDPKTINWKEYMPQYCYGVKRYLLKK